MPQIYETLQSFFNPATIAFVGASEGDHSIPARAVAQALKIGYPGKIIPINPRRKMILSIPTYPSIEAVPGPVDLAVLLRPYQEIPDLLAGCGRKGARFALVVSGGFAEMGQEGWHRQETLLQVARSMGIRVMGPNCMGYINLHGKVCTTFSPIMDLPLLPGKVGLVSQSGAMGGAIMNRLQDAGVGISYFISSGNEMDLGMVDFIEYLVRDEKTRLILVYLEGIRDGRGLLRAAEGAFVAGKPLIVLQTGASEIGRKVTASHTGNLAISGKVLRGALRQKGAILCRDLEELVGTAYLLSSSPPPSGKGIGIIATSGGATGLFADWAEEMGLDLPAFSPSTSRELGALLKFGTPQNPLDLTGQVAGDRPAFFRALELVLNDEAIEVLLLLLTQIRGPMGQALFQRIAAEANKSRKPIVALSAVGTLSDDCLPILRATGRIMIFRSFGQCARSLRSVLDYLEQRRIAGQGEIYLGKKNKE
jgi:acetyltransferase